MSNIAVNTITDASGGNTATINGLTPTVSNMAGRNRIINGDMRIDQRNAGASVALTADGQYTLDRWRYSVSQFSKLTSQQSTTVPAGFKNSLAITVSSAVTPGAGDYFGVLQPIEGYNVSDFGLGTASPATFTLSFWVRSSLTGTFSGMLYNNAANRTYCFTYAINSANTWEQKTITVTGDTTGTWATDNTAGLSVYWDLGSGSNGAGTAGIWSSSIVRRTSGSAQLIANAGATFYITGVQLEAGSVATPFEHRQYGQELALCQRYYYRIESSATEVIRQTGYGGGGTTGGFVLQFPVTMRANPTGSSSLGATLTANNGSAASNVTAVNSIQGSRYSVDVNLTWGSSYTGAALSFYTTTAAGTFFAASAEL